MTGQLEGAVALVNAAAGTGIGSEVVRGLLREGASVALSDMSSRRLESVQSALVAEFGSDRVLACVADASDEDAVAATLQAVRDRWGRLDILVNSVGYNRLSPWPETSREDWDAVINASLTSHYLHARAAWPLLVESDQASIVNISSVAAERPTPYGEVAYAAAKGGVLGLTQALAGEGVAHAIRANAVMPGLIWNDNLMKAVDPDYIEAYRARNPMRRDGTPGEVADVVLFLASSASRHVSGQVVRVAC